MKRLRRIGRVLRAIGPLKVLRFVNGDDVVPHVPPWFPHNASAIRLVDDGGWFKDHRMVRYLEHVDAWPGAHDAF